MPLEISHDSHNMLQKQISEKIAAISIVENDIPAMLIIHDIRDSSVVYMSKRATNYLGVTLKELHDMGPEYHTRFFNPEDAKDYVPKILGLLQRTNDDESISHYQQVRKSPTDNWNWFLSSIKVILRDDLENPVLTLTTATAVDAQHHLAAKAQRMLEENNFLRKHYDIFNRLTKREKEILRMLAMGYNADKLSKELFISENTAKTHRRNIKQKLLVENNYDITRFAQAFNLI